MYSVHTLNAAVCLSRGTLDNRGIPLGITDLQGGQNSTHDVYAL